MSFKKNAKVTYRTPRGGQAGTGRIAEILNTTRGVWYEVVDTATKTIVRLRAANINLA